MIKASPGNIIPGGCEVGSLIFPHYFPYNEFNNPDQEVEGAEGRFPAVVLSADEIRMVTGSGPIEAGKSRSGLRRAGAGEASSNFDSSRTEILGLHSEVTPEKGTNSGVGTEGGVVKLDG